MTDVASPTVAATPKRDLHRMQRIFRGTKTKLTLRPFNKSSESSVVAAVTLTQLKTFTSGLTTEEIAKALADSDPIPAVVAVMSARAARFGVAGDATTTTATSTTLTAEQKAEADALLKKRSERFGASAPADALESAISKIDPAVLSARESRFADPRAAEEKEAVEKRAARFGAIDNNATNTTKGKTTTVAAAPVAVALTPEQQAQIEARARRFGA